MPRPEILEDADKALKDAERLTAKLDQTKKQRRDNAAKVRGYLDAGLYTAEEEETARKAIRGAGPKRRRSGPKSEDGGASKKAR